MTSFYIFADALEYIEERLCEDITRQDILEAFRRINDAAGEDMAVFR